MAKRCRGSLPISCSRDARLVSNLYGPTETTIWSSAERVRANQPISIGRPIANTQIYIFDPQSAARPPSVSPGELHIGGVGLARGYLNRPELTAEKFIPNPFHATSGARLYKTGDLARYLPRRQDRVSGPARPPGQDQRLSASN